jgi:hypothetical protein
MAWQICCLIDSRIHFYSEIFLLNYRASTNFTPVRLLAGLILIKRKCFFDLFFTRYFARSERGKIQGSRQVDRTGESQGNPPSGEQQGLKAKISKL